MPATDEGRSRLAPDRGDIPVTAPVGAEPIVDDVTGTGADEEATTGYVRSPRDLLRLVAFAATSLLLLGLTRVGEGAILGFEEDLVAAVSFLSPAVERVLAGVLVLGMTLAALAVWIVPLVTRRYRLLGLRRPGQRRLGARWSRPRRGGSTAPRGRPSSTSSASGPGSTPSPA